MDGRPLGERLAARIGRHGPIGFDEYVEAALYDPDGGFYTAAGGAAGRRGDFLTAPEVGPLFGAVLARALDEWWSQAGEPDPWVVVEAGAGRGTLARSVLAAEPRCRSALRYVLVERSAALRALHARGLPLAPAAEAFAPCAPWPDEDEHRATPAPTGRGPLAVSLPEVPSGPLVGVVVANELLDNLPFALAERTAHGWAEVRVGTEGARLCEVLVPGAGDVATWAARGAPGAEAGQRVPVQRAAASWLRQALDLLAAGRVVAIDYGTTTAALAARPWAEWVRTYRAHERGGHPLDAPGTQDVTCEVALDQLATVRPPTSDRSQAEFLAAFGIDALVEQGRAAWRERAHVGDLAALAARSRAREAEALCDPGGMGAFRVLEWVVGR